MSVEARTEYVPGDPILIRDIISQLKSQGVFDQFRKECISDVDTKPAYQNLCHRVDGQVSSYLSDIRWGPDLNKNQLRENIRKFVNECTFVEPGIARIVDQLVNPRINTVLVPKVEDIVYQYVGIPPVERHLLKESSCDSNVNHAFANPDSSFEKSRSSNSSQKRNHENESSWSRFPSRKFENYVHSKKDSSGNLPSLFDLKVEHRDEIKEKNDDSRMDFFHSEGGDDDDSRAYSTIDSDEDNLNDDVEEPSPSFEAFGKPDTCNSTSADSDYPAEVASSKDNFKPQLDIDEKSTSSNVEHNDENINTDSLDGRCSQTNSKIFEEMAPSQFDVPKTPTINYETSEDSDDNNCLKIHDTLKEVSMEQDQGTLADDIPDFSSVDKIAKKIAEDNREQEKIGSGDDERLSKNGDCNQQNNVVESTSKIKDDKADGHLKDSEKDSSTKSADNGTKDSKDRERKHSEHRKDKHKSDKRDSSRDDRERRHREKERSNHDSCKSKSSKSRTESRDKTRKSSDEKDSVDEEASSKLMNKDDQKSHRSQDDRKSRDKDDKKQKSSSSGERRSKDDKSKEKRSRSNDGREDRKKRRHDSDRSKDGKKSSQEDEKVKVKKSDGSESKKRSKSQCGSDEKKTRTDRRSSDRDSNGPSSSSNHSHYRSSSKSDKEKHSDKSRHSSSVSSTSTTHKSKKSDNTKKDPSVAGDLDTNKQDDQKNSKISLRLSPAKRSLEEMNSKEMTSFSNEVPNDCRNSPLKISENNLSVLNIKKPKIARNESEFGKVVRLRKEYKEKMRLLHQQGKENNNSESGPENEEKQIIERLSPVSMLKETKAVPKSNKNGLTKEIKLSITRIDACYKIINGTCVINDADNHDDQVYEAEKPIILSETDTKKSKLKIEPGYSEKQDKLFKLKICRSISPTSGKERTKCVQSETYENEENKTYPVSCSEKKEDAVFYPSSENDDEFEEENLNDEELLRRMNIEEIIGCRTDCTRISYDSGLNNEKNVSDVDDIVKDHGVDKNVVLYDEDNKENVGTETQCVNDASTNRVPRKNSPEVRYFEPSSPSNDFTKFVEKMIRESEDVSLLNFSIELDYPKEYDALFRNQFGATVKRVIKVDQVSSDNLASTSTASSIVVKESVSQVNKETSQSDAPKDELKSINELNSASSLALGSKTNKCDSSLNDQAVAPVQKVRIPNTTKRKTLGIKRRISNISGNTVYRTLDSSKELPFECQTVVASRVCDPSSGMVAEGNFKKTSTEISATLPVEESACLNTYTHEILHSSEIILERLPITVEEDEKKRIYSSLNNNVPESSSYPVPTKTPKKPRKNSPVRSCNELLTDVVPKRTPYQNKCYYDSSDLYKPRPSFLASSRRSRALNPDNK